MSQHDYITKGRAIYQEQDSLTIFEAGMIAGLISANKNPEDILNIFWAGIELPALMHRLHKAYTDEDTHAKGLMSMLYA